MEVLTGVCVSCFLWSVTALVFTVICMRQANDAAERAERSVAEVVKLLVSARTGFSGPGKTAGGMEPHGSLTVFNQEGGDR